MKKGLLALVAIAVIALMYDLYHSRAEVERSSLQSIYKQVSTASPSPSLHSKTVTNLQQTYNEAQSAMSSTESQRQSTTRDQGLEPKEILIPVIHVDAKVGEVGLLKNGQLGVPPDNASTAWYKDGPAPGEKGNAIIDGHVDSYKGPAVFFNLKNLSKGDRITVIQKNGQKLTFEVYKKVSYPMNSAPLDQIFGYAAEKNLNLITCTGYFNHKEDTHIDRLVVFCRLI